VGGWWMLCFARARRRGAAVATAFLQPIEFRHPQGNPLQGSPNANPQ
jgi:hypothetical protein